MKARLAFDPAEHHYGPATESVRRILSTWVEVDWYAPPPPGGLQRAADGLQLHQRLAHAAVPGVFPERVEIEPMAGDFSAFAALCRRVQTGGSSWDWKFQALKRLSRVHSEAHGWTMEQAAVPVSVDSLPLGQLILRLGEHVIWNSMDLGVDLAALPDPEAARWYHGYTQIDRIDCLEWQLAEPGCALDENPFSALLSVYANGHYPFSLGPSKVILFSFA
ncbi:MAG: hypothetical protein IPJ34_11645 [Myxococcales bacterium]|nr:hypothetical protein [Myxococcales bacterium]